MEADTLIVVAIDFGTTYSGYAYSSKDDFMKDPSKVYANEAWNAGGNSLLSRKTPTCLLMTPDQEFHSFGYEAEEEYASLAIDNEHKDWYYFKRFKMKLHGESEFEKDMVIEDETGKTSSALLVFSESIKYLKNHFMEKIVKHGILIKTDEIKWVLTVPAIWSDSAKRFMRRAAVKAGIKNEQLTLALEPEAASIYCQHLTIERSEDSGFSTSAIGTRYMVVDLGGGTADITIHEKLSGGALKELHTASGGVWGGTAVDDAYLRFLSRIVGGPTVMCNFLNFYEIIHSKSYT